MRKVSNVARLSAALLVACAMALGLIPAPALAEMAPAPTGESAAGDSPGAPAGEMGVEAVAGDSGRGGAPEAGTRRLDAQDEAGAKLYVDGAEHTEASSGTGSGGGAWSWDGASRLTLNGYDGGPIAASGDLEVELVGENVVHTAYSTNLGFATGIAGMGGLTLKGQGQLSVMCGEEDGEGAGTEWAGYLVAITALTLDGARVRIDSSGSKVKTIDSMYAEADVCITNGAEVTAVSDTKARGILTVTGLVSLTQGSRLVIDTTHPLSICSDYGSPAVLIEDSTCDVSGYVQGEVTTVRNSVVRASSLGAIYGAVDAACVTIGNSDVVTTAPFSDGTPFCVYSLGSMELSQVVGATVRDTRELGHVGGKALVGDDGKWDAITLAHTGAPSAYQNGVQALSIEAADIAAIPDQAYDGTAKTPGVEVRFNGDVLVEGTDYALSWSDNVEVGTATATVTGRGRFVGTKSTSFMILGPVDSAPTALGGTDWSAVYDPAYYAARNPDVADWATGADGKVDGNRLLSHFVGSGRKEGRASKRGFELASYYNANPDLRRAFGADWARYYDHYRVCGQREGRAATGVGALLDAATSRDGVDWAPVYYAPFYARQNPDVACWATRTFASGSVLDDAALLRHFVDSGTRECRSSKAGFDVRSYYNANPDLRAAFGGTADWSRYYRHYATNGARERRWCAGASDLVGTVTKLNGTDWSPVYDRAFYGQRNPDVVSWATRRCGSATVLDDYAMLSHFVNNGRKEGRASKASFELASYYNANADLRRAFGTDWARYYDHYRGNGQREGRAATGVGQIRGAATSAEGVDWAPVYDALYYAQKNSDVANWATRRFSSGSVLDDAALLSHFVGNGTREGRASKQSFEVHAYKSKNADLARALGDDWKSYYRHYAKFGANEHRACV